jgi:hypothetical protein
MPNWAEGSLKIRGPIKNIKRFLDEGIQKKVLNTFGKEMDEDIVYFNDWSDECGIEYEYHFVSTSHIKHTSRAFIDPEIVKYGEYAYLNGKSTEDIDTIALPFKQAWKAAAKSFEEISKEYGIDIAIHTFEKGAEFEQDILIEGGKIVKDEIIEYDNYLFESALPMLGG